MDLQNKVGKNRSSKQVLQTKERKPFSLVRAVAAAKNLGELKTD